MGQKFSGFVDLHTHVRTPGAALRIVNSDSGHFDSDVLAESRLSLGLHPWNTGADDIEAQLDWIERHAAHPRVVALGECGLDRLRGAPLDFQMACFRRQLALAQRLRKPVIVHCVKAFGELIRIKREQQVSVPVIVHGFNNRPEIAADLLRHGFRLSFGAVLLKPGSNAARVLAAAPEDGIFLETDDSGMAIEAVYAAASALRHMPVSALQTALLRNFWRLFDDDE